MDIAQTLEKKIEWSIKQLFPPEVAAKAVIELSYPPEAKFGDYSCNVAMRMASALHQKPMDTAVALQRGLGAIQGVKRAEVMPPGFLNFFLDEKWLIRQLEIILQEKQRFGSSTIGQGKRVQVEFVSANPTGPIHVGNGRGGFAGDTLANVLQLAGYKVQREYYINDVGNQSNILAESVLRRYWQHQGIKMEYPDYCYQGAYIDELARGLFLPNYKLTNVGKLEEVRDKIKGRIMQKMISNSKRLLTKKLGIRYDKWFSERTLYRSGQVDAVTRILKEKNLLYKSEGAIWLKTQDYGDDKNRVIVKENGDPVYFLSDIAYHWNKLAKRKFDQVIDIWGADHHGYVGRMQAAIKILGFEGRLNIIIAQLVRLMRQGQEVKMSKRSGSFVTLEELVDEVGVDAARFFFLMRDFNTHMDFDLDLAKKKSKDNPVYYVQYAHARICSIMRKAKKLPLKKAVKRGSLRGVPLEPSEIALLKTLLKWPEIVRNAAAHYQVHQVPFYAIEVATRFHDFYTKCKVIEHNAVIEQRFQLIRAAQVILHNVLSAMGISAPERM